MTSSYSLDQYVRDPRTITAEETDPVRITDRVAPLAKKSAQTPGWLRQCEGAAIVSRPGHDLHGRHRV
jgi:hypothetical protein